MAHFRAEIEGNGTASRLGTKASRIHAEVQSHEGKVTARLYHDAATGKDMALVQLDRHHGAGCTRVLYHGPVDGSDTPTPAARATTRLQQMLEGHRIGEPIVGIPGQAPTGWDAVPAGVAP